MDEAAPDTMANHLQEALMDLASGLITNDRASAAVSADVLLQLGNLAVQLEKDLDAVDVKILSLESDDTDQRDEIAIEVENRVYFVLAHVVDALTSIVNPVNENEGELA
jgi:hypothetical protein